MTLASVYCSTNGQETEKPSVKEGSSNLPNLNVFSRTRLYIIYIRMYKHMYTFALYDIKAHAYSVSLSGTYTYICIIHTCVLYFAKKPQSLSLTYAKATAGVKPKWLPSVSSPQGYKRAIYYIENTGKSVLPSLPSSKTSEVYFSTI